MSARPATLRGRLFAATAGAVVAAVAISLLIGGLLTRHALKQTIVTNLGRQADTLSDRLAVGLRPAAVLRLRRPAAQPRVALLGPAQTARLLPADARSQLDAGHGAQGSTTVLGTSILFAARPLPTGVLLVYRAARIQRQDWSPFLDSFLIAGLVGAALAAAVSFVLARRISRPVMRVAAASRALGERDSPGPLPVEGPAELATLATSFNRMRSDLDAARDAERAFLLSVSHELKTPLTAIRGYVEAIADGTVGAGEGADVIGHEAMRLDRLVGDLLDLARLDQRAFAVERGPIDLASCAREVVRRYARQADDYDVSLAAAADGDAPATGDADRLIQVASNLVENALRVTPASGRVTITALPGALRVEDTGPGLDPEDLPHAFERFYLHRRLSHQRPVGSGLGLAIVKELTEAMGGTVTVSSSPGVGSRFEVRLPPGPPAAPPGAGLTRPTAAG